MKVFEVWDGAKVGRKLEHSSGQRLGVGTSYALYSSSEPQMAREF